MNSSKIQHSRACALKAKLRAGAQRSAPLRLFVEFAKELALR
jgi:hypothetical protein